MRQKGTLGLTKVTINIISSQGQRARSAHSSEVVDLVGVLGLLLPEGEVLLEELDDALGVTEVVLLELVDLVERVLEGGVGELAGDLVVLHDLVVEDGEVEGKAELDGVAGGQLDLVGLVVSLQGRLLNLIEEGVTGVLSDVAVVVTDHLDEEGLGLTVAVLRENVLVDDINDVLAVMGEGLLDFELVGGECGVVLLVLGVLLDGGNGAAGGSLGGDQVLESHGEEVALIGGDVGALLLEDLGQEGDHVFESLGLFSNAGKEDLFFDGHNFKFN